MTRHWLIFAVVVGAALRFWNLDRAPLWIDEMLFARWIQEGVSQEYPLVFLGRLFGLTTELELRLPSAIAGTLTIPAVWWALKNKRAGLIAAWTVAVFPVFVFWSRMARPYAAVGLFVVIGWRWWPAYLLALATNPIALLGLNTGKVRDRWWIYLGLAAIALVMFLLRPDAERLSGGAGANPFHLLTLGRFWYVPLLAILLHIMDYAWPRLVVSDSVA